MKYFIKVRDAFGAQGPFEIHEINARIAAGTVTLEWVALGDIGAEFEKRGNFPGPEQRWVPLREVIGIESPSAPPSSAQPEVSPGYEAPPRSKPEPAPAPKPMNVNPEYEAILKSVREQPEARKDEVLEELRKVNHNLGVITIAAWIYIIGAVIGLLFLAASCGHTRQGQPHIQFKIP